MQGFPLFVERRGPSRRRAARHFSLDQDRPVVVDVGARRAGNDERAERREEPVGVVVREKRRGRELLRCGPFQRVRPYDRTGVVFRPVDAVGVARERVDAFGTVEIGRSNEKLVLGPSYRIWITAVTVPSPF